MRKVKRYFSHACQPTSSKGEFSKAHFQRQLDVTAVPRSREPAGIGTDNSVTIRWIIYEVCAVQDVEKLGPELQIPAFTQKRERGVLVH